jgi:hypothetical protein
VDAIAMPKRIAKLVRLESPAADLPQILHLAEMLMQLVGQGRLQVLAELLEAGKVYRGMTKPKLAMLVEGLQPQVDQLGQALSLELTDKRDYKQTLLDAHRHMAALSEQVAGEPGMSSGGDFTGGELLAHASELSGAMREFFGRTKAVPSVVEEREKVAPPETLLITLLAAANRCRERRQELSLIIMEPNVPGGAGATMQLASRQARHALEGACGGVDRENISLVSLSAVRTAAVFANCERRAAIAVAQNTINKLANTMDGSSVVGVATATTVSIGVATASVVPRNFDPGRMIECGVRCLSAARAGGMSAVKSIEV